MSGSQRASTNHRAQLGLPVSQRFPLLLLLLFTVRLEQLQEKSIKENNSLGECTRLRSASGCSPSPPPLTFLCPSAPMMHDTNLHGVHVTSCHSFSPSVTLAVGPFFFCCGLLTLVVERCLSDLRSTEALATFEKRQTRHSGLLQQIGRC